MPGLSHTTPDRFQRRTLAQQIHDLARPHRARIPVTYRLEHAGPDHDATLEQNVPSLLTQLDAADPTLARDLADEIRAWSRRLTMPDTETTALLVETLHLSLIVERPMDSCHRRTYGLIRTGSGWRRPCCTRHDLEHQLTGWWALAVVTTGPGPAWQPDHHACPTCHQPGTLRIRLAVAVAVCTSCRTTWQTDTLDDLSTALAAANRRA